MIDEARTIIDRSKELLPDLVDLRRAIHLEPEIGLNLPSTQAKIVEALSDLDLEITLGESTTSVTADLVGDPEGPTVLLRGDMDALPMPEDTGLDFASTNEGAMHACGHDSHVAMLVGAARLLAAERGSLPGRVRFMFQPGEEGFGGAEYMIREGVLEGVDSAFALHITPNAPSGWLTVKSGPMMASADTFHAVFRGKGGHASMPHFAVDPIPGACEFVSALHSLVTRRVDVFDPAVVTVAHIESGTTTNVIPETALVEGTFRTVSEATRASVARGIERLLTGISAAHECEGELEIRYGYPVTVNDPSATQLMAEAAAEIIGEDHVVWMPAPVMGAEDFSYVLQRVPGAMAFLGVCPPEITDPNQAPACHSNKMLLDEAAMATGVAVHANVARTWLHRHVS
ncbi:MAG TPA: amidohydrolase [Acidimicrobiales bacterium]|nr:amidohydrolase [Acidimicrobiales bacterium]